jgi:hypothetical protein
MTARATASLALAGSTSTAPAPSIGAAATKSAWPTPRRLQAYLAGIAALTVVLLVLAESTLARERRAIRTIGKDAAPSVVVAEQIYASLSDFDANVGNTVLGYAYHRAEAEKVLEKRRTEMTTQIVDAAENITFGDAEKVPILRLADRWVRYLDRVSEVRLYREQGDLAGATARYLDSSRYLHAELLPAASALDSANRSELDRACDEQAAAETGIDELPIVCGLALLGALVAAQIFCFLRMRRVLNPGLAAASLFGVALTLYLAISFARAGAQIHSAKADAFESIHALWRARALAYDANGEETRWLLAPAAGLYDVAFDDDVRALTSAPADNVIPTAARGLFADEMHNITYYGERDAAQAMVQEFARYYRIDRRIRDLERSHRHPDAIILCLGESNDVFDDFDKALGKVIVINQSEFDHTLAVADGEAAVAQSVVALFAAAIVGLAFLGIRARLREYNG